MGGKEVRLHQFEVLDYIRRNIPLERIREVEEFLAGRRLLSLRQYFERSLLESVYRGYRGSYKIDYSKTRGIMFLCAILYIVFGEPKLSDLKMQRKIEDVLKRRLPQNNPFVRYSKQYLETKIGGINEKTGWIDIAQYTFPILGGEIFFYCTLKALMEICGKAHKNKNYKFPPTKNWKECIVYRFIGEVIGNNGNHPTTSTRVNVA